MATKSWNAILNSSPGAHVLQTAQWAEVKSHYGWKPYYLIWHKIDDRLELEYLAQRSSKTFSVRAAALVLERKVLPGLSVMYLPKGPHLVDWEDTTLAERVLNDLEDFARQSGVIQLKIDPDVLLGWGVPGEETEKTDPGGVRFKDMLKDHGWRFSTDQIQFRNTVLVDLSQDEDDILARMKSKTRYNIRLAGRKGISVRLGDRSDLKTLYRMYADTSVRGQFTIRGEDYYQFLWNIFLEDSLDLEIDPIAQPLIAEYEGNPVAGVVIFKFGDRAWYLHGMSLPEHNKKMAPHLLQWEAMRWAKEAGCHVYDMWGAPDKFNESDSLWGVYRFKRGYGGQVARTIGAWDYPARPLLYTLYTNLLPRLLGVMRWFGNRRTRISADEEI
jgi:lipid II:glycine glycyltransferase (peptidoglycan interpeptide bridge formation enzyme)